MTFFLKQNQPVAFVKATAHYELKLVRWKIPGTDGTLLHSKCILSDRAFLIEAAKITVLHSQHQNRPQRAIWIHASHDGDQWWALVNAVLKIRVAYNAVTLFTTSATVRFSRRNPLHGVRRCHIFNVQCSCCSSTVLWPVFGIWPPRYRRSRRLGLYEVRRTSALRSTPQPGRPGYFSVSGTSASRSKPVQHGWPYHQLDCASTAFRAHRCIPAPSSS
jgi:hypothetical protein